MDLCKAEAAALLRLTPPSLAADAASSRGGASRDSVAAGAFASRGMISGVLFLNQKGEVLLNRFYRDGVTRQVAETFRNQVGAWRPAALVRVRSVRRAALRRGATRDVLGSPPRRRAAQVIVQKEAGRCPVVMFGNSTFMYIKAGTVFVVAVSQGNARVALVFQFLTALVNIIKAYCGAEMNDDTIRNNFVLIYELLDEVLDYGFPQNTTIDLLKMYITQQGEQVLAEQDGTPPQNITIQATGAISWRKEGIKYRKNELFIDVVEQCNLMVSNKGTVLRNDVSGNIMVKCYLTGMPECKFGLNDKLLLDNEARNSRNRVRARRGPPRARELSRARARSAGSASARSRALSHARRPVACRRRPDVRARASRSTTARSTSASSSASSTRTGRSALCRPTASSS